MRATPEKTTTTSSPETPTTAAARCRRAALVCGLITIGLAGLSLLGWATNQLILAGQIGPDHVPMAPATAVAFLLAGVALLAQVLAPSGRWSRHLTAVGSLLLAVRSLAELFGIARQNLRDLEEMLFGSLGTVGAGVPIGQMSPFTAVNFLLISFALPFLFLDSARYLRRGAVAGILAIIAVNLLALLAYVQGASLTFLGFIPSAANTVTGFLALSIGLIAAFGPDHFPLRLVVGPSTQALLCRAFLLVPVLVVLLSEVLRSQLLWIFPRLRGHFPRMQEFTEESVVKFEQDLIDFNLGIGGALTVLISGILVSLFISHVAKVLGGRIDRAESDLRHALEELERARDAAEESSRAKGQFLATMSHELRNPLNAVIGYCELLQEEAQDQGLHTFLPDLARINIAAKHLLALINDILDLSKFEAGKIDLYPESFDVRGPISEVATTIQPLVEKNGNTLQIYGIDHLGRMHTDVTRLRQCLLNLLSNAAKFTQKGVITLQVTRQPRDGHDWVCFRVSDTGIGMTEKQARMIFQPFTQVDSSTMRKYGGTGLGLTISRKLSELMGGRLFLEKTEPGKGSTFTLEIPATIAKPGSQTALPSSAILKPPEERDTILVVDDDPMVQDLLTRFLSREGFYVVTAPTGEDGLRLARELHPQAITLDVMMPHMDGWSVLSALKADPAVADIPVIMLTIVDDKNLGCALGAAEYLTKPIDRSRLLNLLKTYRRKAPLNLVLVVEDDPVTRQLLRRELESGGFTVVEATNGRQALEYIARRPPALILLDLMMPDMDGFEFITELRQHADWRSIPLVVITSKDLSPDDRTFLNGSMLLGGCVKRILQKGSFNREDLLREVRDLVAGQAAGEKPAPKLTP
jgi:signal transduction histidine kinase/CheY-like chemotaxis protein